MLLHQSRHTRVRSPFATALFVSNQQAQCLASHARSSQDVVGDTGGAGIETIEAYKRPVPKVSPLATTCTCEEMVLVVAALSLHKLRMLQCMLRVCVVCSSSSNVFALTLISSPTCIGMTCVRLVVPHLYHNNVVSHPPSIIIVTSADSWILHERVIEFLHSVDT